jgi:hypothetical protein
METLEKNWYVNIDGTIHEASGETVDKWIWDGTILSHHTLSRGGQRWLEARRVPQFSSLFVAAVDGPSGPAEIGSGMAAARSTAYPQTLSGDDLPTPLGLKISMGSAIALAVALLAGYLWAFQISSPPDRASLTESPEMRALQVKYDMEKKRIEDIQIAQKAKQKTPDDLKLNEFNRIKINCERLAPRDRDNTGIHGECADQAENFRQAQAAYLEKFRAAVPHKVQFDLNGQVITSVDKGFETLDLKLEADQKQTVIDLQKADTRSRFYRTFVLLFLGLAGLNIVRLTLFSSKNND